MSYTNVYPTRINWENEPSIASPINATNLNKLDYAAYEFDQTFATWDITKANQSDLLLSVKSIDYDTDTGVFVFTWQNGTTETVDLNIEKIPVSFSMDANGVITMTTDDGTTYTADVGSLIKTYTFTDSSEIDFTVTTDASGNKTITAGIVAGSIAGSKLEPNYLANCQSAANSASASKTAAEGSAEDSEAWAVGTRDGVPVPSSDPAYENNSKYWAEHTTSSFAGLTDTDITNPQDGQVPVYNSTTQKWENADQSAGGGSKVVVSTAEASLIGTTCTLSKGGDSYSATFDSNGVATFEGVTLTGTVTITATDGQSTATRTLEIPYFGNYTQTISFFSATITATFPADKGATCTCDGVTASTSPYTFTVGASGTYSVVCTLDGVNKTTSVTITTDGQTESVNFAFGTINLTYDNAFRGLTVTCSSSGTTITKTAPISGNTMAFYPPSTGEWIISSTYSGTPYQVTATITSLATPVSASLQQVPDGSTVTPTDDIQKWLNCAGIFDKTSYTTLADVLADSTTLLALMSDNNASDYLVRSKSWATASGLVPTMTSDTTPSGECSATNPRSGYEAYKAFDNVYTSAYYTTDNLPVNLTYHFPSAIAVRKFKIAFGGDNTGYNYSVTYKIRGSQDNSTWEDLGSYTDSGTVGNNNYHEHSFSNSTEYSYYQVYITDKSYTFTTNNGAICELQFYATTEAQGICDNSTAMTDIGANNYCANTLLSDSTWCNAICNSTYFESVLNVKVPTMTSDTTPSGVCGSTPACNVSYPAFQAFDNDDSTEASLQSANTTALIYYAFTSAVEIKKFKYYVTIGGNPQTTISIKYSDDGSNWTTVDKSFPYTLGDTSEYVIDVVSGKHTYWGLERVTDVAKGSVAKTLQFYGR